MQSAARLRQDVNKKRYERYPETRQQARAFKICGSEGEQLIKSISHSRQRRSVVPALILAQLNKRGK